MSQAPSTPYATPPVYDQWRRTVMDEIGLREAAMPKPAAAMASARTAPLATPLANPPAGRGPATGKVSRYLAKNAFGSAAERTAIDQTNANEIGVMHLDGRAAPVQITSAGGRVLDGSFFSADGHNLKENATPDTTRPAVLLLTGSGGSSEDQGLDMAKHYAQSGASVLSVNFGGFGNSTGGDPSEQSLYEDASAMLQHLVGLGYDPNNIIIHGYSLGGAVAGKLLAANEASGHTFKGAVLDRPMVSMVSGVEARTFGKIVHPVAAMARDKVGRLSARDALLAGHGATPMVVTADEGQFARDGEALRQALHAQGNRTVTGQTTGQDHFDHATMLQMNDTEIGTLIAGGNPPPARPALKRWVDYSGLRDQMKMEVDNLGYAKDDLESKVARFKAATTPPPAGQIKLAIATNENSLKIALDLSRSNFGSQRNARMPTIEAHLGTIRDSMIEMVEMLDARGETVTIPPALVDAALTRCDKARTALTAAGGVGTGSSAEAGELLAARVQLGKLEAAGATIQNQSVNFVTEIDDLAHDIRAARIMVARRAAVALNKLGALNRPPRRQRGGGGNNG